MKGKGVRTLMTYTLYEGVPTLCAPFRAASKASSAIRATAFAEKPAGDVS